MEAKKNDFELVPYDLETATVETLKTKYLDLTLPPDDSQSYAMVMGGLRECREMRLSVDAWHKDRKAMINKAAKHYDGERRRVYGLIEPIEDHLKEIRKDEDDRKAFVKAEKDRIEKERVDGIRGKLNGIAFLVNDAANQDSKTVQEISNSLEKFEAREDVFMEFKEEAVRLADETYAKLQDMFMAALKREKEDTERKAEAERLEKIRKQQAEAQAQIDEENRKIQVEKDKLAAEKRAEEQRKREEEIARQAAERAVQVEKDRQAQAERDRIAKEKADAEEAARKAELLPDKEKFIQFANNLKSLKPPDIVAADSHPLFDEINSRVADLVRYIIEEADAL